MLYKLLTKNKKNKNKIKIITKTQQTKKNYLKNFFFNF